MNNKERKNLILDMRRGLNGFQPHTLEEIGKKLLLSRQRIFQLVGRGGKAQAEASKEFFTCPQLIKQPWFPIKSLITLRKLIVTGQISAHIDNPGQRIKRYVICKGDAVRYLDAVDYMSNNPGDSKHGKDYLSCPALVKQRWFPIKSLVTLRKLIDNGKIKAVNVSTNPKTKHYYIHKDEAIRYIATILKDI